MGLRATADSYRSHESLVQEADLAMYRAKDRGRDRAEVFDEELRTKAVGRLGTERMLRRAIDEERLRVDYQPIIDLRTGGTVAGEAPVRVWDPEQPGLTSIRRGDPPTCRSRRPRTPRGRRRRWDWRGP